MADTLMRARGWGKGQRSPGLPAAPYGPRGGGLKVVLITCQWRAGLFLPPLLRAVKPPCTLTVLDSEYLVV